LPVKNIWEEVLQELEKIYLALPSRYIYQRRGIAEVNQKRLADTNLRMESRQSKHKCYLNHSEAY
jgi:hypothetical protein